AEGYGARVGDRADRGRATGRELRFPDVQLRRLRSGGVPVRADDDPARALRRLPAGPRSSAAAGGRRAVSVGTENAVAIRLDGVHKSFGRLEVLRGIDLDVARHEVICLIGASGSGKSTMLRCINLLERIDAGR